MDSAHTYIYLQQANVYSLHFVLFLLQRMTGEEVSFPAKLPLSSTWRAKQGWFIFRVSFKLVPGFMYLFLKVLS